MDIVYLKTYSAPPIDRKEILRYASAAEGLSEVEHLLDACLEELGDKLTYKVCFCELPIEKKVDGVNLGFAEVTSEDLKKNLDGCERIVLFAATVGIAIDRLIARYKRSSPAKALLLQAIGAERIEALCDVFNHEIADEKKREGLYTRPRFSPGYGDFSIAHQKKIFDVLDCPRKIGASLNESLLMSPSKSVTAIIGLSKHPSERISGCKAFQKNCSYRRII